jgi:hemolysin-activating ACP:hemolysin acyltransferase
MFFGKKPPPAGNAAPPTPAKPAAGAPAAGGAVQQSAASPLSPEDAKKRAIAAKQIAASFGEIVTLLMRSPTERQHSLQDLEWLVIPAIARGQFAVADAQSKETGAVTTVGTVLWAFVSAEIDKRLEHATGPLRLQPNEWRSGDIPWIILAVGDPKVVGSLLQQLTRSVFKDRPARMRVRGADGKVVVGRLELSEGAARA